MISIIITSKNEPKTITKAINAFLDQDYSGHDFEILAVAPDEETGTAAGKINSDKIKIIQDQGQGKPAALNLVIPKAKGDILIFTDGEVWIEKNAVKELLKKLNNSAVTGRPVSINDTNTKYGLWSRFLVDMAHKLRINSKFIFLSGYLFAIHKKILNNFKFPENILTEDEYLSYYIYNNKKYKINYAPGAVVNVKYPDNYSDWIAQKTRTLGGLYQIPDSWKSGIAMRSFIKESSYSLVLFEYGQGLKQKFWLFLLVFARLHAWAKAFILIKIFKKNASQLWIRIESTK